MVGSMEITTEALRETAGSFRDLNSKMKNSLGDIKTLMNNLSASYESEDAREIITNMNNLQGRFDEYESIVESYAKFLESTAQTYDATVQTNTTNAEGFRAL